MTTSGRRRRRRGDPGRARCGDRPGDEARLGQPRRLDDRGRAADRPDRRAGPWRAARVTLVDGAQAIGAIPVEVGALGVDFYAIPAQKWLLGPEGIAALYCAPAAVERARQTFAGLLLVRRRRPRRRGDPPRDGPPLRDVRLLPAARRSGWPAAWPGCRCTSASTGSTGAASALARATADRLAAIPGVELLTPRERMANLISFRIAGWTADEAFEEISRRSFAIFRTLPTRRAPDQRRVLQHARRSSSGSRRPSSSSPGHTPGDDPAAADAGDARRGSMTADERGRDGVRRRGWFEVRWRQFRNAPRPVVRAVLSPLVVAIVLGLAYLAYDVALTRGATLPGRRPAGARRRALRRPRRDDRGADHLAHRAPARRGGRSADAEPVERRARVVRRRPDRVPHPRRREPAPAAAPR